MRRIVLNDGTEIPVIGQGTWRMGERGGERATEVKALQAGVDLGLTLIDTAEMYGSGGAEEVVGEALKGRRDRVYLVSKVLPSNASRAGTVKACEQSLKRLGTDHMDLYLLHWRGSYPLADTLQALLDLKAQGKIRAFGVSNLDVNDMREWMALPGAEATVANQILYNVGVRGPELDLAPAMARAKVALMAYCPLAQGDLTGFKKLEPIARRHNATVAQIMLAWSTRNPLSFAVPKSSNITRLKENAAAGDIALTPADLSEIDAAFPVPGRPVPLEMI
ncbi:aldo/keto reductase [Dongia sp.]|uniref:aldo/keto reductase n=1 Tax=Dongia sp. TaxID=1977262 RepID=UPI0035B111E5